jgi:hypothetical protein
MTVQLETEACIDLHPIVKLLLSKSIFISRIGCSAMIKKIALLV